MINILTTMEVLPTCLGSVVCIYNQLQNISFSLEDSIIVED